MDTDDQATSSPASAASAASTNRTTSAAGATAVTDDGAWLTIGELARRTGVSAEVLRAWESRHAFPVPERLPSGHRRYRDSDVAAVGHILSRRRDGVRLDVAIAELSAPRTTVEHSSGSILGDLRRLQPQVRTYPLTKRTLLALSWAIEDECSALGGSRLLIGAFQRRDYFDRARSRWHDLARTATDGLVLADFEDHDDAAHPALVALPPDSPALREWVVVIEGHPLAAMLVGSEFAGQQHAAQRDRRFEAFWSTDSAVTRDAAIAAARIAAEAGSETGRRLLGELLETPAPPPSDPALVTALHNRMIAYRDGSVRR